MNVPLIGLIDRAAAIQRQGRRCVLCLVIGSRGSTPQAPGALMLVDDAAMTYGTIGGGCVEAQVRRDAFAMLGAGAPEPGGTLRFTLNHDYGWDDGLICGGTLDLIVAPPPSPQALDDVRAAMDARRPTHIDLWATDASGSRQGYRLRIPPRDRLYIAGAGHVGQAVARAALTLEFDVHVFDDRADLLASSLPPGARGIGGEIADSLRTAEIDPATYCLVVTRGHRHDEQALGAVVGRGAAYVGMIGSRRKVKLIFDDLGAMGVPREALAGVRAPVGLDIGAVTVEEIAISIAAELVQTRRRLACGIVQPLTSPHPQATDEGRVQGCGVRAVQ